MAVSLKINKNTLIPCLNKLYYNLNLDNEQFLTKLKNKLGDQELSQENIRLLFYDQFKKPLDKFNTHKPQYYLIYWLIRGWDEKTAKEKVQSNFKKDIVFFTKDEIFNYIIEHKLFEFNVNNKEFIRKFVDTIIFEDHIVLYNNIYKNFFSKWINSYFNNIKNKGYLTLKKEYYLARGYSEEEAEKIIHQKAKENSYLSEEFYIKRGFTKNEAKVKISKIQSDYAKQSKANKQYWLKLGLNENDAIEKSRYYSSLRSVWGKKYWMNKGYSEEEALQKTHEYNNSCFECKKYDNDYGLYLQSMNNLKEKQKNIWSNFKKDPDNAVLKLNCGWFSHVSKAEKKCFELLINEIDKNIKHEPYIVVFPENFESKNKNNYFYVCDGYLEYNKLIIIIEYDGGIGVFHTEEQDKIRDNEILMLDNNILGILRIQETFFKKYDIINIKKIINYEIQEIKNCKKERVILC